MRKYLPDLCCFVLGLFLSVVIVYRGNLRAFARSIFLPAYQTTTPDVRSGLPDQPIETAVRLSQERDRYQLLLQGITPEERLRIIASAFQEGTLDALQVIRPDLLSRIPDYETRFHREVKRLALRNLLLRFEESDWSDWKNASFAAGGGPSAARLFVDNVSSLNPALGRYLETATQLFHGLYLKASRGRPYDIDGDLRYIQSNAEDLLAYRKNPAESVFGYFVANIASDDVFRPVFENVRGQLYSVYTGKHPQQIKKNLELLQTVDPDAAGDEVITALKSIVLRLASKATPNLRDEVLTDSATMEYVERYSSHNTQLREALGRLYLVRVFDLLERGESQSAAAAYEIAKVDAPQFAARPNIETFVQSSIAKLDKQPVEENGKKTDATIKRASEPLVFEKALAEDLPAVESMSISALFIMFIVALVGTAGIVVFFFIRSRVAAMKYRDYSAPEPESMSDTVVDSPSERRRSLKEVNQKQLQLVVNERL